MTFEQSQFLYRLSHNEEVSALVNAGIDPNIDTWDTETLERASVALDQAQAAKIERLTMKRNSDN